jgi:hypothetical protein
MAEHRARPAPLGGAKPALFTWGATPLTRFPLDALGVRLENILAENF